MKPDNVDKLIADGPYSIVRHPNFTGIICMNIAYLFFFRTLWLIPPICMFRDSSDNFSRTKNIKQEKSYDKK